MSLLFSNEMLHLVFASPNDVYYGDGMLELGRSEYLWLELRERYSQVFFLHAGKKGFSVSTIGGKTVNPYEDVSLLKSRAVCFKEWLTDVMTAAQREKAALVCDAEDFNKVLGDRTWDDGEISRALVNMKNRTGLLVLTMPLEAERSRDLLAKNPLIAELRQDSPPGQDGVMTALLNDSDPRIRHTIVSPASGEMLDKLLLRAQIELPGRLLSAAERTQTAAYLRRYLGSCRMQRRERLPGFREPSVYLSFHELHERLKKPALWRALTEKAGDGDAGQTDAVYASALPPDGAKVLGRCVQRLSESALFDTNDEAVLEKAEQLIASLLAPRDEALNPAISRELELFLPPAHQPESAACVEKRLQALRFCADWLCLPEGGDREKEVASILRMLNVSLKYLQETELAESQKNDTRLYALRARQVRENYEKYQAMVNNAMDLLSGTVASETLAGLFSDLETQTAEISDLLSGSRPAPPEERQKPQTEAEEEKPIMLTAEQLNGLYSFSFNQETYRQGNTENQKQYNRC